MKVVEFLKKFDIKHRQPTGKNCGVYALANVLNEEVFAENVDKYGSNSGHTVYELNSILKEAGFAFHLAPVYVDKINNKLPENLDLYPTNESQIMPCIIITAPSRDGIWHCVGVRMYGDKTISILDSLRSETIVTTWDKIHEIYNLIEGMYCFEWDDKTIEGYAAFE